MIIDINHPHVADIICYDRYGRVLKYLCYVDTDTMKGKQYVVYRGIQQQLVNLDIFRYNWRNNEI